MNIIAQFNTDILHISKADNVVPDTVSRIQEVIVSIPINFVDIATAISTDDELTFLAEDTKCSLKLQPLKLTSELNIVCGTSNDKIGLYVHLAFRKQISTSLVISRHTDV